jgi:hypothetical protein
MLLDWPEQKRQLADGLQDRIRSESRRGLVAQVRALTFHEGKRAVLIYPNGDRQELTLKSVQAEVTLDRQELSVRGPQALDDAIHQLAEGLGDQMDRDLIGLMQKADPRHGGMFGGKDDREMFQALLSGLREMDMSFEEDGSPSFSFVVHPDTVPKLQALNTPERRRLVDQVIEEKRNEWLRREGYRRLAD